MVVEPIIRGRADPGTLVLTGSAVDSLHWNEAALRFAGPRDSASLSLSKTAGLFGLPLSADIMDGELSFSAGITVAGEASYTLDFGVSRDFTATSPGAPVITMDWEADLPGGTAVLHAFDGKGGTASASILGGTGLPVGPTSYAVYGSDLSSGTLDLRSVQGLTWDFTLPNSIDLTISTNLMLLSDVPEPSRALLIAGAFLGACAVRRRPSPR